MFDLDLINDSSKENLTEVPPQVLQMSNLRMLYLQQNFIKELPEDFFQKLPNLSWLDLRNNQLWALPQGIANHINLQNLLVSDNKIKKLPNELGLVPNLKVLQVANNPLEYPPAAVVAEGTKAVLGYLRDQYEIMVGLNKQLESDEQVATVEEEIKVVSDFSQHVPQKSSSLTVKSLSQLKEAESIVHQVTSQRNKISVKSFYPEDEQEPVPITSYQETWVDKLKQLLEQQERILQQEKNLQALEAWRKVKKAEPLRASSEKPAPPYATEPTNDVRVPNHLPNRREMERLIGELVDQLKTVVEKRDGNEPSNEIAEAGTQIFKALRILSREIKMLKGLQNQKFVKITEMHKKLVKLLEKNDKVLQ